VGPNQLDHYSKDAVVQQLLQTAYIYCTTIDSALELGHPNSRHTSGH
jgi:hypothetical protein